MSFPYEAVPDGTVFVAHHYFTGLLLAAVPAAVVWDDYRRREPVGLLAGILLGLLAFVTMWPYQHLRVIGALLAAAGPLLGFASLVRVRQHYPARWLLLAALGLLVAADDWVSHAFGWWTPLDWVYHAWLLGVLP